MRRRAGAVGASDAGSDQSVAWLAAGGAGRLRRATGRTGGGVAGACAGLAGLAGFTLSAGCVCVALGGRLGRSGAGAGFAGRATSAVLARCAACGIFADFAGRAAATGVSCVSLSRAGAAAGRAVPLSAARRNFRAFAVGAVIGVAARAASAGVFSVFAERRCDGDILAGGMGVRSSSGPDRATFCVVFAGVAASAGRAARTAAAGFDGGVGRTTAAGGRVDCRRTEV